MRHLKRLLIVIVATSCGGISVKDGPRSPAGSAGESAVEAGSGSTLAGSAGAIAAFGGMGVGGQAGVAGSSSSVAGDANMARGGSSGGGSSGGGSSGGSSGGGSSGAPTDHCAGPLTFADPDVEHTLRQVTGNLTKPMYAADLASLTLLDFFLVLPGDIAPCPTPGECPTPEPPVSDGWVTSLAGLECLPHLQEIHLDAWYVADFSPLAAIGDLKSLKLFTSRHSRLPPLPQLRELTIWNTDGDLSELSPMPNLTSLFGHFQDLSAKNALGPLSSFKALSALALARSKVTDLSGIQALNRLATVDFSGNDISDLSPLLQNTALGSSTTIDMSENPITCDDPSMAALLARKVNVEPCAP